MPKTITGSFKTSLNAVIPAITPLTLILQLSGNGTASGVAQVTSAVPVSITLSGSSIPGGTTIFANDELTPGATTYNCKLVDANNNIYWSANLTIAGVSPIDITTLTPS